MFSLTKYSDLDGVEQLLKCLVILLGSLGEIHGVVLSLHVVLLF